MDVIKELAALSQPVNLDAEGNVILSKPVGPLAPATLSDSEAYGQRQCASCTVLGCSLWCSACNITDVGKIRTFYCSPECQKKHRPEHKDDCPARVQVARASSILYELFYAFEKATHIKDVPKIAERDGVLTIGRGEGFPRAWTGGHLFVKFPEESLPAGTPKDVADRILLDHTSTRVALICRPLLSLVMEPFVKSVHVAFGTARNPARVLYGYQLPGMTGKLDLDWEHSVLKIRAGRSEVYALDLTGAQFGWKDILYNWNTYAKSRFAPEIKVGTIEHLEHTEGELLAMYPRNSVNAAQNELPRRVMAQYVSQLQDILNEHFLSLRPQEHSAITKLIKKKNEDFVAAKANILRRALECPQAIVDGLGNVGRLYLSTSFAVCVATTEEEAARYAKVWFKKDDPRVKELPPAKLMALWRKRMSR